MFCHVPLLSNLSLYADCFRILKCTKNDENRLIAIAFMREFVRVRERKRERERVREREKERERGVMGRDSL